MIEPAKLRTCLETMRLAAMDVQAFTGGLEGADLTTLPKQDRRTYRALRGALLEISELAAALPFEVRSRHPGVDWRGWIGLCDLLSADGLRGEMHRIGPCVEHDVPSLLNMIHTEIGHLEA